MGVEVSHCELRGRAGRLPARATIICVYWLRGHRRLCVLCVLLCVHSCSQAGRASARLPACCCGVWLEQHVATVLHCWT